MNNTPHTMKPQPRVYSYTRFSTPEQALGDSERRQIDAAHKFAQSKNLPLDDTLSMIDRGLSGYHGAHRQKGALGTFLQKVESGEVPRGSILVVENLDRLGREPVTTALKSVVFTLVERGIVIETLSPPFTYTTKSINDGGIWQLVAYIMMSHAESEKKADRSKANWQQKRRLASQEGRVLTERSPAWLKVVDGRFKVIPEAAKAVQLIYQLKREGFGKLAIEKRMNAKAPWTPPCGWRASYIDKILRTKAVLGEFQPHRSDMVLGEDGKSRRVREPEGDPVLNYFPPVVTPKLFHAVQQQRQSNQRTGGVTGKCQNLFQNLVKCGYCGGSMVLLNLGTTPGRKYLCCDNGRRGVRDAKGKPVCRTHAVRYDEFEETMLNNLSRLRPEVVLPDADEQAQQASALRDATAGISGQLADIETQVSNLVAQIAKTSNPAMQTRYERMATELEAKKPELDAERNRLDAALRELERGSESFAKWQKDMTGLKRAIAEDVDARIRLKTHLKGFIAKIDIYAKGHQDMVTHCEALIEQMPELERSKHFRAFERFMQERLLSLAGRFYRLHLRTAKPRQSPPARPPGKPQYAPFHYDERGIPIAPVGSLAARMEIRGKDKKHEGPELGKLLREFFDTRKPGFVPKAGAM